MSLDRLAFSATVHCLTGCAIGEVLGMIIGTALGWSDLQTIALASGVSAPSVSSVPLAVSAIAAAIACRRGGRSSRFSIMPAGPSRPGPSNQPNSFWVP
jgi:uncharacterized protein DUF4396